MITIIDNRDSHWQVLITVATHSLLVTLLGFPRMCNFKLS